MTRSLRKMTKAVFFFARGCGFFLLKMDKKPHNVSMIFLRGRFILFILLNIQRYVVGPS